MFKGIKKNFNSLFRAKSFTGIFETGWLKRQPLSWGPTDFLNAYEISLYTNKAIEKRAEKVGEIEFIARDKKGQEVPNDPLVKLLTNPNKLFTGSQFWSLHQKYKDLTGSAYILLENKREIFEAKSITSMHLLRPDKCKPNFNDDGTLLNVEYQKFDGSKEIYETDRIIYSFRPDPKKPLEGISLLKAGARAIDTEQQISEYHANILKNAGKVEGVFKFKTDRLTPTQLKEIKESYEKELAGARKAGRPMFLGGDAEYTRLGLTPDELSYLEAKKMSLNDIVILTGVPKALLGSIDDVKFSNAEQSLRIFLSETIRPELKNLTDVLNEKLFPGDVKLDFIDPTPENREELRKDLETANIVHALTVNEYREALGYDSIEGGDKIYATFNIAPLATEQTQPNKSVKTKEGKEFNHPLKDVDNRRAYEKAELKRKQAGEKLFKKELDKYLDGQKKRIVGELEKGFTKDIIDEIFNLELEVSLAKESLIPIITQLFEEAGESGFNLGDTSGAFRVTPDIRSSIESRMDFFSRSMNKTTFNELKNDFQVSVNAGEGRKQLIRRLSNRYEDISKGRANTIARTETLVAVEQGKNEGYKQAGIPIKIWVATFQNTRDTHASMDGQEVPVDQAFQSPSGASLRFPGDSGLGASASETVNCQCSI